MVIAHGEWIADVQSQLRTVEANVSQKLDMLLEQLDSPSGLLSEARFRALLEAEVNRLDGYLAYRLDRFAGPGGGRAVAVPDGCDVLVSDAELDIVVPAGDLGLLAYLLRHGLEAVEPGVRAVLRGLVRPGDVVADVGANIGLHAVTLAAAVGPEGRVLCVEPLPQAAAALRRSLRLNGFADHVQVHEVALADSVGRAQLHVTDHSPMSSLFPLEGETSDAVEVPQTTLDDLLPPGSRVDVVKMDVEGAEPLVWHGMARVRADNPALAVVLEWSASHFRRSGHDPAAFMRDIADAGYSVEVIDDDARPGQTRMVAPSEAGALEGSNLVLRPAREGR
jgi:FkbM family methyltransferase